LNDYDANNFSEEGNKLDRYQSIKCVIKVFVSRPMEPKTTDDALRKIEADRLALIALFKSEVTQVFIVMEVPALSSCDCDFLM